jgi:hypothetical protein
MSISHIRAERKPPCVMTVDSDEEAERAVDYLSDQVDESHAQAAQQMLAGISPPRRVPLSARAAHCHRWTPSPTRDPVGEVRTKGKEPLHS